MTPGLKFRWHKAFMVSDLNVTCKAVGARMWDHASADGGDARPGNAALAADLRLSERTVIRTLGTLRESGWLVRTSESNNHPKRNWADVYRLNFPDRVTPVTGDQDSDRVTTEADRVTNGTDRVTPVTTPPVTSVRTTDPVPDPFTQDHVHQGAPVTSRNAGASAREGDPLEFIIAGVFDRQQSPAPQERAQDDVIDAEVVNTPPAPLAAPKPEDPAEILTWCLGVFNLDVTDDELGRMEQLISDGMTKYGVVKTIREARGPGNRRRPKARTTQEA